MIYPWGSVSVRDGDQEAAVLLVKQCDVSTESNFKGAPIRTRLFMKGVLHQGDINPIMYALPRAYSLALQGTGGIQVFSNCYLINTKIDGVSGEVEMEWSSLTPPAPSDGSAPVSFGFHQIAVASSDVGREPVAPAIPSEPEVFEDDDVSETPLEFEWMDEDPDL